MTAQTNTTPTLAATPASRMTQLMRATSLGLLMASGLSMSGCYAITRADNTVPAHRLDRFLFAEVRDNLVPVPMTALGQDKPTDHQVGAGDILAIYVYGVLPASTDETLVLQRTQPINQRYYPPHGSVVGPTTGVPVTVAGNGTIDLPLVGEVQTTGLTLAELRDKLKALYVEEGTIKAGRERISVSLITPRVRRVVVIREDTPNPAVQLTNPGVVDQIHRGSGETIDLPVYENDVLHALAQTGGLPGTDAPNELWVFHQGSSIRPTNYSAPALGSAIADHYAGLCGGDVTRIPLKGADGEPIPFSQQDVILDEGDVVYVPRREEYFLVGGLVPGARIPIPRDHNIDIVEAVALATGSVGGPAGIGGQALSNGSPGYIARPTRAIVVRKLPDGRQLRIRVDLGRAAVDHKERIVIQDGDLVMLHHKPLQGAVNTFLNAINFSFVLNRFDS